MLWNDFYRSTGYEFGSNNFLKQCTCTCTSIPLGISRGQRARCKLQVSFPCQSINQCLILINIPSCITEIYPQLSKLWTIFFNLYVFKYIFRLKIKNVQSHSMILIKKVFEFKLYIKVRWIIIFSERWRPPYLKFG